MKLKPYREKQSIKQFINDTYSVRQKSNSASINIDVEGCINLENFKKLLNYDKNEIALEIRGKSVYIYGKDLSLRTCNRYTATVFGDIDKIEIFSKEVK